MDNTLPPKARNLEPIIRLLLKLSLYKTSDPEAFLTFARKGAESICKDVFSCEIGDPQRLMLDELIKQLRRREVLPAKIEQPLITIQKYGNFAAHHASTIDADYIVPAVAALHQLTKWFFVEYLGIQVPVDFSNTRSPSSFRSCEPNENLSTVTVHQLLHRGWTIDQIITNTMALDYETLNGLMPDHEGDFHQWATIVLDHPETVTLLLENATSVVGYWHFVPLFDKEFKRMKRGLMSIKEVTSDKIPLLALPGIYDIYFVIITLSKRHRYSRAVRLLFESFIETLQDFAKQGVYFREICTDAYTPTGIGICRSFQMKLMSKHPSRGQIYARKFFPFPKHALFDSRTDLQTLYQSIFLK